MNPDIAVLREVCTKVTQMLAGMGICVTQRGTQAYVETDRRTLKPRRVNIPYLPDNATEDLILGIQGFIDHEVAHILFTDWKVVKKAASLGPGVDSLQNIVEDTYIERAIQKKFPGSVYNLEKLHKFFIEHITKPALEKVRAHGGSLDNEFGILLVPMARAWAGQRAFADFMKQEGLWTRMEPFVEKIGKLALEFPKVQNSEQALDLAIKLDKALNASRPKGGESEGKERAKAGTPGAEGEGKGTAIAIAEKEPDAGEEEGEETGAGKVPAPEPEEIEDEDGEEETPAPHKPAPVEDEDEDEDAGAGEKDEDEEDLVSEDDEDDGADPGPNEDDGDVEGDAGEDVGDGEGDGDEAAGDTEDEADPADVDAGEEVTEEPEDEGKAGAGSGDTEDGDDGAAEAGESEGEFEREVDERISVEFDEDEASDGSDNVQPWHARIDAEAIKSSDFDDAVSAAIGKEAAGAAGASEYRIFSRDWDRIEKFQVNPAVYSDGWMTEMENRIRHMVGVMQKDVERMMAARSQVVKVPGFRSGKLHAASLHKLVVGDSRVFRRKQENRSHDTAATLLIDCSGSMGGTKIHTAMSAAYALSQTLERVGIKHEVIGFTTDGFGIGRLKGLTGSMIRAEEMKIGKRFSRVEALYMPIFKGFEERLTTEVKRRFAAAPMLCDLANNIDGESVEVAGWRLLGQKASRRVLLVMSDGQPAAEGNHHEQVMHLESTIRKLGDMRVETVGIGIMSDAVRHYYPRHVVLRCIDELPGQVMSEVRRILS